MVGLTWVPSSYPRWEDVAPFVAGLECHQRAGRDLDTLLTLEAGGCTKQERPLQTFLSIQFLVYKHSIIDFSTRIIAPKN